MKSLSPRVRSYCAPFADSSLRENTLFVRYEDLTREPQHEVQRLRDFTGLALADSDRAIATVEHECAGIFESFGYRPQSDPQAP